MIKFARRGSVRRSNASIGCGKKKELMLQTKPLNLECGELRLRDWRRCLRKYRWLLE